MPSLVCYLSTGQWRRATQRPKGCEGVIPMEFLPVLSATGQRLMPCRASRARQLLKAGKAVKCFSRGLCYLVLTERRQGDVQPLAVGVDPGSKKEAFTVQSEQHTFLNVQADAVTWVTDHIK